MPNIPTIATMGVPTATQSITAMVPPGRRLVLGGAGSTVSLPMPGDETKPSGYRLGTDVPAGGGRSAHWVIRASATIPRRARPGKAQAPAGRRSARSMARHCPLQVATDVGAQRGEALAERIARGGPASSDGTAP